MREIGAHRRVVRIGVEREAVHHRQRSAARPVRGAERLDERCRRRGRADSLGPVGATRRDCSAPDAQARVDRLERVVGLREEGEVGRRRRDRPVGRELRQPEAVQVRLVADDDVVEARQGDGEGGGVLRELRLGDRIERRRRRAGRVDRDVDPDAREPCGRLDVAEDLELAGRRRGEAGSPVGGDADRRHPREAQLGHLRLRGDEIRRADGVLGGAERHRRAACERGRRKREKRGDRADERGQDAAARWGYASSRA